MQNTIYISNKNFRDAVKEFLSKEAKIVNNDIETINKEFTPFKRN